MRIKYCFIILLLFPFYNLFSQETLPFTFFPWVQSYHNPAALGEKDNHLNFTGVLRQQAMGMHADENNNDNAGSSKGRSNGKDSITGKQDGQDVLLNIDSYIKKIKGAVGVYFLKDRMGAKNNVDFGLGYAAKIPVHRGKLGIGLQFLFLNQTPASDLTPNDNPDNTVTEHTSTESFLDFDMNVGVQYKTPTWYAGLSCTHLLNGAVRISGSTNTTSQQMYNLYAMGGYIWNLKTEMPWTIEPSILIKTNLSTWTCYAMAIARYNGILWFGLSYEHDMAIAVLLGAVPFYNYANDYLKGLELGLSYGFSTAKYGWTQGGSWGNFELVVRYGLNFYKEKVLTGYGSSRHLYKNQY